MSSTTAPRTPTAAIQVEPANNGRAWEEEAREKATDYGPQDADDDVSATPHLAAATHQDTGDPANDDTEDDQEHWTPARWPAGGCP